MWRWSNFLHSQVPPGQKPLRVNMDETAIRLVQTARRGMICSVARRLRMTPRSIAQQATRGQLRTMFSLIAFVCDDDDLQKKLPQILVVSSAVVKASDVEQMRRTLPPNVFLWSQRRAWTTGELMVAVVRTLRQCLESDLVDRQVILSSDVFRAHTTKAVWRAMARLNFFYFLIPARMTWVMQPCDTHVFAQFKRHLQEAAQTAAVRDEKGYVPLATLFDIVGDTVQVVLRGKRWAHAFHDLGLAGNQERVSASVLQKLGLAAAPQVGASLPTLAQLQEIWPTNAVIPIDLAFGTVTKYARACAPGELRLRSGGFCQRVAATSASGPPAASAAPWPTTAPTSPLPRPLLRAPVGRRLWPGLRSQPLPRPPPPARSTSSSSWAGRRTSS